MPNAENAETAAPFGVNAILISSSNDRVEFIGLVGFSTSEKEDEEERARFRFSCLFSNQWCQKGSLLLILVAVSTCNGVNNMAFGIDVGASDNNDDVPWS